MIFATFQTRNLLIMESSSLFLTASRKIWLVTRQKYKDSTKKNHGLRTDYAKETGYRNGRFYITLTAKMVFFVQLVLFFQTVHIELQNSW